MRSGPRFCKHFVGFFHFVIAEGAHRLAGEEAGCVGHCPLSWLRVWDVIPWKYGTKAAAPTSPTAP